MSKRAPAKGAANKGPLDHAWKVQTPKDKSPKQTDAQDQQKTTHDEEMLPRDELLLILKDHQDELKKAIKDEINELRDDFQQQLDKMGAAVQLVNERTETCETLVKDTDANMKQMKNDLAESKKQADYLFSKCEDLENRERRRNLRLRGVPEKAEDIDIINWAEDFLVKLQPDLTKAEVALERAHRVGPLLTGTSKRPRDMLIRFYNFQAKEKILQTARNVDKVYCEGEEIAIFQDIAQTTLQRRAALKPITAALRDKGVRYKWMFPFGLGFMWNNKFRNITTLADGRKFLPDDMFGDAEETEKGGAPRPEGTPWPWTTVGPNRQKPRRNDRQPTNEEEGQGDG